MRYTYEDCEKIAHALTEKLNQTRNQGIKSKIPYEVKAVIHTWNNLKCLRLEYPPNTWQSEYTRYFNTYEDLYNLISACIETIDLVRGLDSHTIRGNIK